MKRSFSSKNSYSVGLGSSILSKAEGDRLCAVKGSLAERFLVDSDTQEKGIGLSNGGEGLQATRIRLVKVIKIKSEDGCLAFMGFTSLRKTKSLLGF